MWVFRSTIWNLRFQISELSPFSNTRLRPFSSTYARSTIALHILSFSAVMPFLIHFFIALALISVVLAEHGHHGRPMARQIAYGSLTKGTFPSGYRNSTSKQSATATGPRVPNAISASVLTTMPASTCDYWLQNIDHQGFSPSNANPTSYQVFRNVKDFGAAGLTSFVSPNTFGLKLVQVMVSRTTPQQSITLSAVEGDAAQSTASPQPPPRPLYTFQRVHILSALPSSTSMGPN